MQAHLTASLAVLEEMYDDLSALIAGIDEGVLNWTPPVANGNSIAVLTRHIAESCDAWLYRAAGMARARDRDAEFLYAGSAADLQAIIQGSRARLREQFSVLNGLDPNAQIRYTRIGRVEEQVFTVAWCIAHAVIHAGEHWGEIQLNRQLFEARGAASR